MIISKTPLQTAVAEMDKMPVIELGSPLVGEKEKIRIRRLVADPAGTIGLEDFLPGTEMRWAFHHDEAQLVISGKAEVTYSLPPSHSRVRTVVLSEGDSYMILKGTYARFKVISDVPFRHFAVIMPRTHYEKWLLEDAVKFPTTVEEGQSLKK
ncbi:MAG: hypothetical protein HYX96_04340 [Chloroflexi bacterium]|nr:hypothetical protein [Chloroflexota bacterium]